VELVSPPAIAADLAADPSRRIRGGSFEEDSFAKRAARQAARAALATPAGKAADPQLAAQLQVSATFSV
jgi:hypothetical protein